MQPGDSRLLLVGNPEIYHVGGHLLNAAKFLGFDARIVDTNRASVGSKVWRRINWWLLGRRPTRLNPFSSDVAKVCEIEKPKWILTTGIAPVTATALRRIGQLGITRLNFLTDDPFNPAHKAPWFLKALPQYDFIFSPRKANMSDLAVLGCGKVSWLPFAYAPEIHFPDPPTGSETKQFESDVMFAGGADADRIPYILSLIDTGLNVALYGHGWKRNSKAKKYFRGHADPQTLRKAVAGAKTCLCLVRRANRDGNSMRTFEIPAVGGCMLVEDTAEHRQIFGADGECVRYFGTTAELVATTKRVLMNTDERRRLLGAARDRIVNGRNKYADRLVSMITYVSEETRL